MGHLLAHQVIELPRLEHVLNGVAHLDVLLFVGFALTSTLQIGFRRAGCAINSAIYEAH